SGRSAATRPAHRPPVAREGLKRPAQVPGGGTSYLSHGTRRGSEHCELLVGGHLEDMRPQEVADAAERVAPVVTRLPAVALVVVPVDLVVLALDLEGFDHLLGHQRHDP